MLFIKIAMRENAVHQAMLHPDCYSRAQFALVFSDALDVQRVLKSSLACSCSCAQFALVFSDALDT